jgi:ribosome maturation factor RimP
VGLAPLFFLNGRWETTGVTEQSGATRVVEEIAERVAAARGLELVEVEIKRQRGGSLVRLFVDRPGGIGIEDLQGVSEEVSAVLDASDPIDSSYTLEVSSPGLDRVLRHEADYRRFVGRLAKLSSFEPVDGRRHWTGRLVSVEEGSVTIRLEREGGLEARIPLSKLAHGRLEVEFPKKS